MDQQQRLENLISLYKKAFPDQLVDQNTKIKGTSLLTLSEYNLGPYQRIKKWLENAVNTSNINDDMTRASEQFNRCFELMKSRNAKYGDSWKRLRIDAMIDLMIMKLDRCQKQKLDDSAIEVELEDVINYAIFGLVKIRNK